MLKVIVQQENNKGADVAGPCTKRWKSAPSQNVIFLCGYMAEIFEILVIILPHVLQEVLYKEQKKLMDEFNL